MLDWTSMATAKAVLIVGGSGFVGTHLALRLRERFKVYATFHRHPIRMPGVTFIPMNVTNRNWVKRVVYTIRPEVVVYAAGSNGLEAAEEAGRDTDIIHTGGTATVSTSAELFQPRFIYLSNCYAFDGQKGNYREQDTILPSTTLGKAKVGGENFIRGKALNYAIVRSSPVFGRGNGHVLSFLDRLRLSLIRGQRIDLSEQELYSYAPVTGLVELIERLIDGGVRNKVVHYGGLTKISPLDFGRAFAERFGFDPLLVQPTQIVRRKSSRGMVAQLQLHDFSLNASFAKETLKIQPLLLEESFDLIEKQLVVRL